MTFNLQFALFDRAPKDLSVKQTYQKVSLVLALGLFMGGAQAGSSRDTVALFKNAGQSAAYFDNSYGYAGFQAGVQGYSEIVFFEDKRAMDEFTAGSFAFDADASVVAVTAAASGSAGTDGVSGGASGGKKDAKTSGSYRKGVAVFTIVKGGLMYNATIAGQKFSYKARTTTG